MKIISFLIVLTTLNCWGAIPTSKPETDFFKTSMPMEQKWKAYHQELKKNPKSSYKLAGKAINSKDWYLRDAGLKTLMALDETKAKKTARVLFEKDPSFLVRLSALKALKIMKDKDSSELLWSSLSDKKNFRGDHSLWIRPKIVSTLIDFKSLDAKKIQILKTDKDPKIVDLAYKASN